MRLPPVLGLVALLLAAPIPALAQSATPAVASPTAASGDFAGLVDIGGGRRLWLECRGSGGPTVVLEAGYRTPAAVWTDDLVQRERPRTMVLPGVARFTRVCAYERPGVTTVVDGEVRPSRSDPVPMPRPAERVVADFHALLQAADVSGPYVLVGHSFGGLLVRLYAATYPDEVVGLVLVDAASEEIEATLTPAQLAAFLAANAVDPPEVAGFADYETIDFGAGFATMAAAEAAQPLPPLPLVVLARGQPYGLTEEALGFPPAVFEEAWRASQERLARLTPDARLVVAAESPHYIQLQQPELVIAAIRQVVETVQQPSTWATPASPAAVSKRRRGRRRE